MGDHLLSGPDFFACYGMGRAWIFSLLYRSNHKMLKEVILRFLMSQVGTFLLFTHLLVSFQVG